MADIPVAVKAKRKRPIKPVAVFTLIAVISIIVSGIFYLIQINNMVAQGYDIGQYKDRIFNLKSENQALGSKAAEMKSLSYIEKNITFLNLEKVDKISFISYDKGVLVQR